jgi:hypothetical protein
MRPSRRFSHTFASEYFTKVASMLKRPLLSVHVRSSETTFVSSFAV